MKVAFNLFLAVIVTTGLLEFYVSFYFRSFQRAIVILKVGLFMAVTLPLIAFAAFEIMKQIPGFLEKRPRIHLVIFPPAVLICGILAEIFIFKIGGIHYFWVFAGVILAFFLSLVLDAHQRIKYMISDSIGVLEKLYRQVILSLNKSLESMEPYNKGHNERVAYYSQKIAEKMGLEEKQRHRVARAALLHDLGKIGISEKILLKVSELDEMEWESIRHHPTITEKILKPVKGFEEEINIIKYHHEHVDGSGYTKLNGGEIPVESRIIAVADAFDAMTTDRPYRKMTTTEKALKELKKKKETHFDPEVVEVFIDWIKENGDFEKPDYLKIREEMVQEELGDIDGAFTGDDKIDYSEIIKGAARKLTLLEKFYRLMGMKEKYIYRRLFNSLGAGFLLGAILGFSIYSISNDPAQITSFVLQGLCGGGIVAVLGASIESLVFRHAKNPFWRKPTGRFIYYLPAGLVAGVFMLYFVYFRFRPEAPRQIDAWNTAYIVMGGVIAGGVAFLTDFVQKISSLLLMNLHNLEKLYFQLIYSLAFALEAKDQYTRGHSERVALYSRMIGKEFDLNENRLEDLKLAALFHDVGKIGVRISVLHKNARLEDGEFEHMKRHPATGADIISSIRSFSKLAPYVRHHHEHYQGGGYPDGLKGEDIPLYSRIIAVADAFDALVTERPYKKAMPKEKALKILKEEAGTKFDPKVVDKFVKMAKELNLEEIEKTEAYPEVE